MKLVSLAMALTLVLTTSPVAFAQTGVKGRAATTSWTRTSSRTVFGDFLKRQVMGELRFLF